VDSDPYAISATEQAGLSRRLEVLLGGSGADAVVDLTDRALTSPDRPPAALESRLASIEGRLDGLAERFETLSKDAAADASTRVAELEARVEALPGAVITGVRAELAALRHDLADALEEIREDVEAAVDTASAALAATLDEQAVTARGVLDGVQTDVTAGLSEINRSLQGQFVAIRGVTGTLGGSTDRLVGAGNALLAYLGERDRWLERERDRVLHEVLEDFSQGLSGRGRRSLSSRMQDVVDRRRDARDAERYREGDQAGVVIEIPPLPPELAELGEPIAPPVPAAELPKLPDIAASAAKSAHNPSKATKGTDAAAATAHRVARPG
jgi:chromosome segregation ATPase